MYINPFVAGILATLGAEIIVFIFALIIYSFKHKK